MRMPCFEFTVRPKKRKQAAVLFFLFLSCFIERRRSWEVGFFFASSSLCLHCGFGTPLIEIFSTSGLDARAVGKKNLYRFYEQLWECELHRRQWDVWSQGEQLLVWDTAFAFKSLTPVPLTYSALADFPKGRGNPQK